MQRNATTNVVHSVHHFGTASLTYYIKCFTRYVFYSAMALHHCRLRGVASSSGPTLLYLNNTRLTHKHVCVYCCWMYEMQQPGEYKQTLGQRLLIMLLQRRVIVIVYEYCPRLMFHAVAYNGQGILWMLNFTLPGPLQLCFRCPAGLMVQTILKRRHNPKSSVQIIFHKNHRLSLKSKSIAHILPRADSAHNIRFLHISDSSNVLILMVSLRNYSPDIY